jgi:hypothetical protein
MPPRLEGETCDLAGNACIPTLDLGRPIAAPLEQCAQLLGVDLATVHELAAKAEPYLRADGTRIWSLTRLERQLRPEVYDRRRAGTGREFSDATLARTAIR